MAGVLDHSRIVGAPNSMTAVSVEDGGLESVPGLDVLRRVSIAIADREKYLRLHLLLHGVSLPVSPRASHSGVESGLITRVPGKVVNFETPRRHAIE